MTQTLHTLHTPVHIRAGRTSDLEAILAVERAVQSAPHWPASTYAAILKGQDATHKRQEATPRGQQATPEDQQTESAAPPAPRRRLLVALAAGPEDHPALAAFATASYAGGVAEIESIVVAASSRRRGTGRALCAELIDWCRSQGGTEVALEVRAGSHAAIALYAGLGFVQTARRPRYYSRPEEDAILMRLLL